MREMSLTPAWCGAARGQSKKVTSVPGVPFVSA